MSGQTGSNTEKQNFCYDEQNRLIWASNTATPPSAGNGTCGSLTPSSGFNGAGYTSSFVYTHLGQLWQAPLNGTGSNQQYLYCSGSTPHQLQGIYPSGATCSNPGTANYAVQYDNWGNVTKRTYNNQTATLSYNKLDQMIEWQIPGTNQAWYAYNANGDRTIQRTTIGSTTNITVYAFGLEEYTYDGSGNQQSGTHYYSLAGHLIGELTGTGTLSTNFFMTDALGSILATFSNTATSAAILGNQLYGPYGNPRYQAGSMGTNKGFTGQYNDPVSGLDYYNSRYYDPVAGMFLSIDLEQGNMQGMNPYNYAGGNPETYNDPTGRAYTLPGGSGGGSQSDSTTQNNPFSGCAWYDPWCGAQAIWHEVSQPIIKTWNKTVVVYKRAWNSFAQDMQKEWHTVSNFAQQTGEVVARTVSGITAKVIAIVVAVVVTALVIFATIHFKGSSSGGGWSGSQQREIAYKLAQRVDAKRANDNRRAPFAQGCIGIGGGDACQESYIVPGSGQSDNNNHAEKQIYYWAKKMIGTQYQNLAKGSTINVLIYVQEEPCSKFCKNDIPTWARALQAAAPPGVKVNLYVWYQPGFDVDNPTANPITSPNGVAPYYP